MRMALSAWALCAASVIGQDYADVTRLLAADDGPGAAARFVSLINATSRDEARAPLLDRAYADFRDRGHTEAWLSALDALISGSPRDVTLLWYRAYTYLDVKRLTSARRDLEAAHELAPADQRIAAGFAWIAALTWDHEAAAKGSEPTMAKHHRDMAASLDEATGSQWLGLVLGVLVLGGTIFLSARHVGGEGTVP